MRRIVVRARRLPIALFLGTLIAAASAAAIGCSSSSGGHATPTAAANAVVSPAASGTALATAVPPLPRPKTPPSLPTIVGDPFDFPLTKVEGGAHNFTMSVPAAWEHVTADGADRFNIKDGPYQVGVVTVECGEPKSPYADVPYTSAALAESEIAGFSNRPKQGSNGSVQEINVNGHVGATYHDTRNVALGFGTTGNSVFFAEPDCAWAIRFVFSSTLQPGDYQTLFGRVVATFNPGATGH